MTELPFKGKFDPSQFIDLYTRHGHGALVSPRFVDQGDDWIEFAIDYDRKLIGDVESGVLASGPIISLMDIATSISVWVRLGTFTPQVTLDLRVDYLRPATPGKSVFGRGTCYRVTRQIAFVRGQAHDGDPDDPLANVAGTFMLTDVE